jgi:hypothetical protein
MTLKDAFDQEIFVIDGKEYTDEDFQMMPLDGLETLRLRINKKISGLTAAISEKKMDYADGGKGASKEWMIRHKLALSINKRVLTYVKHLINKRNRGERKISDYFMDAAKSVLPRGDFENILTKAHQEMGNKGGR